MFLAKPHYPFLWTYSFLFLFLLFTSCSEKPSTEIKVYNPEDNSLFEQYTLLLPDSIRHGVYRSFYPSGKTYEESEYKNGKLDGLRTLYFENGNPMVKENHKDGRFEGLFQSFYENGQLNLEGYYLEGSMEGEWRRYYDTGEVMEVFQLENNLENGPFVEYYRNGNLKAEGTYKDGDSEHGLLKLYDESGELIRKMNCVNGACRTIWRKEQKE
jgi:antitoxin component YwqK of YwqJK toxin-antitoxin module